MCNILNTSDICNIRNNVIFVIFIISIMFLVFGIFVIFVLYVICTIIRIFVITLFVILRSVICAIIRIFEIFRILRIFLISEKHFESIWGPFWDHFGVHLGSNLAPDGLEGPRGRLDHKVFKTYVFYCIKCRKRAFRLDEMASVLQKVCVLPFKLSDV